MDSIPIIIILSVFSGILVTATIILSTLYYKKRQTFASLQASPLKAIVVGKLENSVQKAQDLLCLLRSGGKKMTKEDFDYLSGLLLCANNSQPSTNSDEFKSLDIESKAVDEETKSWVVENFLIPHKTNAIASNDSATNSMQDTSINRPSILKKSGSNDFAVYRRVSVAFLPLNSIPSEPQLSHEDSTDSIHIDSPIPIHTPSERSRSRNPSMTAISCIHSNPDPHGAPRVQTQEYMARSLNLTRTLNMLDNIKIHDYLAQNYGTWGFDLYEFEKMTAGHALYYSGLFALQKNGCLELFEISMSTAQNWLIVKSFTFYTQTHSFSR